MDGNELTAEQLLERLNTRALSRGSAPARPPPPKGFYWKKGSSLLWFKFKNLEGKWKDASSGTGDFAEAKKVKAALLRKLQALKDAGETDGPLTVERYAKRWIAEWRKRSVGMADFHEDNLAHALPFIREMKLEEVRRRHIRDLVRALVAKRELAPRSILHVYGSLRTMFFDAIADEIIETTPCTLRGGKRRSELPKKRDARRGWRSTAKFEKDEVLALCFDERLPMYRRVAYAMLFIMGLRTGELVVRRWRDWVRVRKPLGGMLVTTAYDRKGRVEDGTKTDIDREVPVHPVLAALLAQWKLSGWEKTYGRRPTDDDFIVACPPWRNRFGKLTAAKAHYAPGARLEPGRVWVWLNGQKRKNRANRPGDLDLFGFRHRRAHDMRRTFISLCEDDGADGRVLQYFTHGPSESEAYQAYRTLSWKRQCDEVLKLQLNPPSRPRTARRRTA